MLVALIRLLSQFPSLNQPSSNFTLNVMYTEGVPPDSAKIHSFGRNIMNFEDPTFFSGFAALHLGKLFPGFLIQIFFGFSSSLWMFWTDAAVPGSSPLPNFGFGVDRIPFKASLVPCILYY